MLAKATVFVFSGLFSSVGVGRGVGWWVEMGGMGRRYPGWEGNPRLWTELRRDFEAASVELGPEEWRRRDTQSFGSTWVRSVVKRYDRQIFHRTKYHMMLRLHRRVASM